MLRTLISSEPDERRQRLYLHRSWTMLIVSIVIASGVKMPAESALKYRRTTHATDPNLRVAWSRVDSCAAPAKYEEEICPLDPSRPTSSRATAQTRDSDKLLVARCTPVRSPS